MRSRLAMLAALALAAISVVVVVSRIGPAASARPLAASATLSTKVASHLGVYETGPPDSYQPIAEFARTAGRRPDLAGYFSGWLEPFKTTFATTARQHAAATLVQIDPTGIPVQEIAAGDYDTYLRAYADEIRSCGHQWSSDSGTR